MKYTVRCGSKSHKIDLERNQDFKLPFAVEVGKRNFQVCLRERSETGDIQAISVNNRLLSVQVRRRADGFPYKVILNGNAYSVEVERVESTRYRPPAPERKVDAKVYATLPGLISRVNVKLGDKVEEGEVLLVLEAMKMENEIVAPTSGIVKSLSVEPKKLVAKGDVLLEVS